MANNNLKSMCLSLMKADSEEQVIAILKEAGYWDDDKYWRWYGDRENNYKDAGNQAAEAEAALVEKITNSRDARLMNECLIKGIDPESDDAPKSLDEAVSFFFNNHQGGQTEIIREWSDSKRTEIARGITISITGNKPEQGFPSISIADTGEGQTPLRIPKTILSLGESIKLRIAFVHGKFNMGGTAALRFCGQHNLQLVISKRNPTLLEKENLTDDNWGFTIVRRNYPKGNYETTLKDEDKTRSSIYTFLAPIGADESPSKGEVLHFPADTLKIFPEGNNAYSKDVAWGTLIKLFEFKTKFRTHFFRDGLLGPLDLLLPRIGLPVRLHECRDYKGHAGSFETTLTGLKVRLEDNKANNLEHGFPDSTTINVEGNKFKITIYAFKEKKARDYRQADKAIIITLNGQTQAWFSERFFAREKSVALNIIKDSILVIVDCTEISWKAQEQLFQNSRDRLSTEPIRYQLEEELEDLLRNHPGLRKLKDQRRREKKAEKLQDSQAFEKILRSVFKHSKSLLTFFSPGARLSNPFNTDDVDDEKDEFVGNKYPTYFKFKKLKQGEVLHRVCNVNKRCRIAFETDVENNYFDRNIDPGKFELFYIISDSQKQVENYKINLYNGIATLNIKLPENAVEGDAFVYRAVVTDSTRIIDPPFINDIHLKVTGPSEDNEGGSTTRTKKPSDNKGGNRELPAGISIPQPTEVFKTETENAKKWNDFDPPFDKSTALFVVYSGEEDSDYGGYDFFINMDNIYLNNEIKGFPENADIIMEQFKIGIVLIGMSLIHSGKIEAEEKKEGENKVAIDEMVNNVTKSLAPVILPMINELSDLVLEE